MKNCNIFISLINKENEKIKVVDEIQYMENNVEIKKYEGVDIQTNKVINEEDLYMDIQEALVDYADENDSRGEIISEADIKNVAANAGMNEEKAAIVAENLYREVKGKGITLEEMIDEKVIKEAEKNREIRALKEQVKILSQRVIELEGEKK